MSTILLFLLALLCFLAAIYFFIGLLFPKLPFVKTRWRSVKWLALSTVAFFIAAILAGASISPEERLANAKGRAEREAQSKQQTALAAELRAHKAEPEQAAQKAETGQAAGSAPEPQPSVPSSIVCNRFKVVHRMTGSTLTVSLDTDLPDDTEVMVSVSRLYKEKGNTEDDYEIAYLEEKSTVGKWRQQREVSVAHEVFRKALEERQRETAQAGIGFSVGSVSPSVAVDFTVPMRQKTPLFGELNRNLSGTAVTPKGNGRIVRAEASIAFPLGGTVSGESQWANPDGLAVGRTYRLSRETPLMPEGSFADPLAGVAGRKDIPAEGTITIRQVVRRDGDLWYLVEARSATNSIGVGLVNSIALIRQQIRVVGAGR